MNSTLSTSRSSNFLISVGAPLLAITAFTAHAGVPVGALSTLFAAVLAGAAVPVANRLIVKPFLTTLGLAQDRLLMLSAQVTLNGAIGLAFAVTTLPAAFQ